MNATVNTEGLQLNVNSFTEINVTRLVQTQSQTQSVNGRQDSIAIITNANYRIVSYTRSVTDFLNCSKINHNHYLPIDSDGKILIPIIWANVYVISC